jgi:hypothetical protein
MNQIKQWFFNNTSSDVFGIKLNLITFSFDDRETRKDFEKHVMDSDNRLGLHILICIVNVFTLIF